MPAKRPEDLPPGYSLAIQVSLEERRLYHARFVDAAGWLKGTYYERDKPALYGDSYANLHHTTQGSFVTPHFQTTKHGWGPLLYDIAIEIGTWFGGCIPATGMCTMTRKDRRCHCDGGTDLEASRDVWQHYFEKRPDVKRHPCCNIAEAGWRSPYPYLLQVYRKRATTIRTLERLGKLTWSGEGLERLMAQRRSKRRQPQLVTA